LPNFVYLFLIILIKQKFLNFLKKKKNRTIENLIDVGAHHGESIKLFSKYFKIKKILAFEPSEENFNVLKKCQNQIKKFVLNKKTPKT